MDLFLSPTIAKEKDAISRHVPASLTPADLTSGHINKQPHFHAKNQSESELGCRLVTPTSAGINALTVNLIGFTEELHCMR